MELNISDSEVEELLVGCVLDGTVSGKIDQVNKMFILNRELDGGKRYTAVENWTKQLEKLFKSIGNKVA